MGKSVFLLYPNQDDLEKVGTLIFFRLSVSVSVSVQISMFILAGGG